MRLATELLKKVMEKKATAQDEMGVPSYDNMHTPDNHVGKKKTKAVSNPAAGLGDRKDKKPTANVGAAGREKRDMEGTKQKAKKMAEAVNPVVQALGLRVQDGQITWHHPNNERDLYSMTFSPEVKKFITGAVQQARGEPLAVFELLQDYHESGPGMDPKNNMGLAASEGAWMAEGPASNPILQMLNMTSDQSTMTVTSPDGEAAVTVPLTPGLRKALNQFITNPDNRVNTEASAAKLFKAIGKVQGAKAAQPTRGGSARNTANVGKGGKTGAGLSLVPQDRPEPEMGQAYNPRQRVAASVGESKHKVAAGEMPHPTVKTDSPAKSAKIRGKQNDAPKNKGNPGSGKEEKGQPKKQFDVSVKDNKGGENEHKSMKKMHEGISELETLLGRELQLETKPSAGLSKKKKSAIAKKAHKGGDIGKKGKGFKKVAKKAAASGAKDPDAVAAAAMWKNAKR